MIKKFRLQTIIGIIILWAIFIGRAQTQNSGPPNDPKDPNYDAQMFGDGLKKWGATALELAKSYFQGMQNTGPLQAPYSGMFPMCRVPAKVIGYGKSDAKGCSGIDQGSYLNIIAMATSTKEFYERMTNPDPQISNGAGTCTTEGVSCINCMSTGYNNQLQKRQNQLTKELQDKLDAITKERTAFEKKIRDEFQPTYNLLFKLDDAAMNGLLNYVDFNNSHCSSFNDADGIKNMLMGSGQPMGLKNLNDAMLRPDSATQKAVEFLKTDVAGQLNNSISIAMNNLPSYNSLLSGKINIPSAGQGNADVAKKVGDVAEEIRNALVAEHNQMKEQLEMYLDPSNPDDSALLENLSNRPGVNLQNAITAWENNSIIHCIYKDHKANGVSDSESFANEIFRRVKVAMTKQKGKRGGKAVIGDSEMENMQNLIKEYFSPDAPSAGNWQKKVDAFEADLNKNKTTAGKMMLDTNGISTKVVSGSVVGVASYIRSFAQSCANRGDKKDGRTIASVRDKVQEVGSKIKFQQEQYKRKMFDLMNQKLVNCSNKLIPTQYGSPKDCSADSMSVKSDNFCYANSFKCAQSLNQCRMKIGQYYTAKKAELNIQRDNINKYVRARIADINAKNNADIKKETTMLEQLGFPLAFFPDIKNMGKNVDFGPTKEEKMDGYGAPNVEPALLSLDKIEDNIKKTTEAMISQYDDLKKEIEKGTKKVADAVKATTDKSMGKIDEYIAACGEAFNAYEKQLADKRAAEQKAREASGKERGKYKLFCNQAISLYDSLNGTDSKILPCSDLVDSLTKSAGEFSLGSYARFKGVALDACAARKLMEDCKPLYFGTAAPGNNAVGYNCESAKNRYAKYFEDDGSLKDSAITMIKNSFPRTSGENARRNENDCIDNLYQDNKNMYYDDKGESSGTNATNV